MPYVSRDGQGHINGIFANLQPGYAEEWVEDAQIEPNNDQLAESAREQRNKLLRTVYDPGILMAQRALRIASSPEETAYAEGKIVELDIYAEALQEVPEQAGFPQTIEWPVAPIK